MDELSKDVSHELLSKVKQKEIYIHDEMKRVQAVDRGTDETHGGSRDGLFGGLYIIEESESRSRLRELNDLIISVEEMVEMEASITDCVDNFSVDLLSNGAGMAAFLETCENVKNRLFNDDHFRRLCCLDEARDRIGNVIDYLCQRVEEELSIFLFQTCKRHLQNEEIIHWA